MLKIMRAKNAIISFGFIFLLAVFLNIAIAEETLTWQDCIKESAKNHPDLIASQEEIKQSQAEKTIAASALFPQIDSSLNASTARTDNGKTSSTADSYSYGLSAAQVLFDGVKTINDVHSASENINASKQSFRWTSATVRYRLRSAFIDLLQTQELLRITQEIYDIRRSNLELVTLRYQSGLEHKGALLTAQADLAEAKYEISKAKRNIAAAQRGLEKEMGRDQLTLVVVKADFEVKDTVKEKPDWTILARNNPSLRQLIARKNAAAYSLKSAYANFSPTLSGQAGANKTGSHWPARNDQWNLGLVLSMPIFEGGLRLAQVSQARAVLNQLRENERSARDSAILTLEQTWAGLQDAMESVDVLKESLIAAEERSRIAQAQYSTGFISFDNWIIIENNLVLAKRGFLAAQANALLAEAEWILAKGETLEYD